MKFFLRSFVFVLLVYSTSFSEISHVDGKSRSKRTLSQNEQNVAVAVHNKYRRLVNPSASDMREMTWDDGIAQVAETHANKCVYEHNAASNRRTSTFSSIGENLYLSSQTLPVSQALENGIKDWDNEKKLFTYSTLECTGVCGHYTQNVWASSYALGCAVVTCTNMNVGGGIWPSGQYVVCNYGPPGNFVGRKPYKQGEECSECPSGTRCNFGLCCDPSLGCGPASNITDSDRSASKRVSSERLFTIVLSLLVIMACFFYQ